MFLIILSCQTRTSTEYLGREQPCDDFDSCCWRCSREYDEFSARSHAFSGSHVENQGENN